MGLPSFERIIKQQALDRLKEIVQRRFRTLPDTGGWVRTLNYDQYGNMWVVGSDGVPVSGLMPTFNDYVNNQISSATYDASGNQTVVGAYTLTYDAENRQAKAYDSVLHATTTYVYDADGRRVQKGLPNGSVTVYAYDAFSNLAAEYNSGAAGALDCETCYLTRDHLGSTRLVTDGAGNVVARHDFLPFGEEVPGGYAGRDDQWGATGDNVNQKFTGKERDQETGLDFFRARYYGSALGRFTGPDDGVDQHSDDPQSWNLYGYVRNNPLSNIDQTGEDCITTSNQTSSGVEVTTERGGSAETCSGTYVNGTIDVNSYSYNGRNLGYSFSNDTASGAGTISFGQSQSDDALSPDVANMLHQAGVMAAPLVNLSGEGLRLGASIAFPFTSLLANTVVGSDSDATKLAGMSRKPGKLGQFKGTDSLRRENKIARDIIKQLNLRGKQAEQVHDIIQGASIDAGEKLGFTELLEIVKTTLGLL